MINENNILNEVPSLKWIPFVGQNYNFNKVLIVGESHYHENNKESILKHNDPNFTKIIVNELAIQRRYWSTKMFCNLHKTLIGNDNFNTTKLWNNIAYYNFVQRSMNTNKGRPDKNDFVLGWEVFFKLSEILQPKICIFVGTSSSNYLQSFINLNTKDTKLIEFKWLDKIGRTHPRYAKINFKNFIFEIYFIQHTSQYFSWSKWHKYLEGKIPNEIIFLKDLTRN